MPTLKMYVSAVLLLTIGYSAAGGQTFPSFGGSKPFECRVLPDSNAQGRNGIINPKLRWPGGVVYYKLAEDNTDDDWAIIRQGMLDVMNQTCITFQQARFQRNYIQFGHNSVDGCVSRIGMIGGAQQLNLDRDGCMTSATVAHEIIHALGFWHEHQRNDRDDKIQVLWDNIQDENYDQFDKVDPERFQNYGPYDLDSVMHYRNDAFTKEGEWTLRARGDPKRKLGNRLGLTRIDRAKIRKLYECEM